METDIPVMALIDNNFQRRVHLYMYKYFQAQSSRDANLKTGFLTHSWAGFLSRFVTVLEKEKGKPAVIKNYFVVKSYSNMELGFAGESWFPIEEPETILPWDPHTSIRRTESVKLINIVYGLPS